MNLELAVQGGSLRETLRRIGGIPQKARRAQNRALRRTSREGARRGLRALSREFDIPQKVLRGRHRVGDLERRGEDVSMSIWWGILPVKATRIGKARQTKVGVRVRGHRFDGAFLLAGHAGRPGVFERVAETRLPIFEHHVDMDGAGDILRNVAMQDLQPYYLNQLHQQLNYEINVRGQA